MIDLGLISLLFAVAVFAENPASTSQCSYAWCYKFVKENVTYEGWRDACQKDGASQISPLTTQEWADFLHFSKSHVVTALVAKDGFFVWADIFITNNKTAKRYSTLSGDVVSGSDLCPSDVIDMCYTEIQDGTWCAHISVEKEEIHLIAVDCKQKAYYVCKKQKKEEQELTIIGLNVHTFAAIMGSIYIFVVCILSVIWGVHADQKREKILEKIGKELAERTNISPRKKSKRKTEKQISFADDV